VSRREKDEEAEFIELAARDVITGEEGGGSHGSGDRGGVFVMYRCFVIIGT